MIENIVTIRCKAPQEIFLPNWDDVPPQYKQIIEAQEGLPCDGGGMAGAWCLKNGGCYWLKLERADDE